MSAPSLISEGVTENNFHPFSLILLDLMSITSASSPLVSSPLIRNPRVLTTMVL